MYKLKTTLAALKCFDEKGVCAFVLFFLACIFGNAQENEAPVVTAVGDQIYCPLSIIPIVTSFNIVDVDDVEIDEFSIQISEGYQRGRDILRLSNTHSEISTSWNDKEGKLTIKGVAGRPVLYADLIPAVLDVVFESTANNPTEEKYFSLTAGSANYLPETGHYYEYVPFIGIPWNEARTAAENRTFFGLQGYLVTISSQAEAQLSGEQAAGTGWIGGSDSEFEGVWKWMTGPEAGTVFWNGSFNGSSPNYAFWNTQEPNNLNDEDYAHITAPGVGIPGSWNDLPIAGAASGDFQPKGYVVEYGGMPGDPVLNLSASTRLTIPKISETISGEICGAGQVTLEAKASMGEVVWFDTAVGETPLFTGDTFVTQPLVGDTTFYVVASENGCLSGQRTPIEAIVKPKPSINDNLIISNCDEDGLADGFTDFDLTSYLSLMKSDFENHTFTFHLSEVDAESNSNVQNAASFNNSIADEVFFRVQRTGDDCYVVGRLLLDVSTTSFSDNFVFELQTCDTDEADGISIFDLEAAEQVMLSEFSDNQGLSVSFFRTNEEAILRRNEIQNRSAYENNNPISETLFVRVDDELSGTCFGIGEHLLLTVQPTPIFELLPTYSFCTGSSVTIAPLGAMEEYDYQWYKEGTLVDSSNRVIVSEVGNYNVIATTIDGCSSKAVAFKVEESGPPVFTSQLIVIDTNGDIATIAVSNENGELGLGRYEYALDSPFGPFQTNPIFENVPVGLHTIYALDLNGCGADEITFGVVGLPKFFTPNNDTINDEFSVFGLTENFYQQAMLFVYDRYGALIAQVDAMNSSWNGALAGMRMPPSDYWYVLELVDIDGLSTKTTGHFTLKQ
ncbi:T9SS type B sorting domain-containing protein [uncultured Croceitalea sp.]|uniref:T9SS type B sorting domain-containing protein n=1 Tax=uncultured Croceitalea sp. TaxID=1798908 RepID=UPI00330561CA